MRTVIHIGLQLPIIRGVQRRRWNFRKADWASYTLTTERSIPLIPVNNISVEVSYQRFGGAMQKAARHSIPRGFRPTYTPCFHLTDINYADDAVLFTDDPTKWDYVFRNFEASAGVMGLHSPHKLA